MYCLQPWIAHRAELAGHGIEILECDSGAETFRRPYDAMLMYVWLDWKNPRRFDAKRIMPVLARYAAYRSEFPETVQIVVNHTDMGRRPYCLPYWRSGDPVLYRTPAYDRGELAPLPAESISPYEHVWGCAAFRHPQRLEHKAGFLGGPTGPRGYRERVAAATARVGIGKILALADRIEREEYDRLMSSCEILVCPRGYGEQSVRHWDTWLSGKPMLTDRECDSVEMIPGVRLRDGVHDLVYDDPEEIPALVDKWTHPSRRDQLAEIAATGRAAALSYDSSGRILQFFRDIVGRR
jgi:hypothetical protein